MRTKWVWIVAVVVAGVVAAGVVAAVGIALGGSDSTTSRADYQATVVNARDRVDFALERIGKSQSTDELVNRIDDAANTVDDVAADLDGVSTPNGLGDENDKLVRTLHAFSDELTGTAATLRDPSFAGTLAGTTSLSFKQWNAVNRVLTKLKSKGIQVEPLARH